MFKPFAKWFQDKTFTKQSRLLTTLKKKPFVNMVKGENAGKQMFSTVLKTNKKSRVIFIMSSAIAFNLVKTKILSFGNEFNDLWEIQV